MIALSLPESLVGSFMRLAVKPVLGPPFPIWAQRIWLAVTALLSLPPSGISRTRQNLGGVPTVTFAATGRSVHGAGDGRPVVLYLHGGAFIAGSDRTHAGLAGYLAQALDGAVHMINYRLAPEHPWPAGRDDALLAYRALLARGVEPGRIIVMGDSAGGVMVADLLLTLADAGGSDLPAGGALLSPAVGLDTPRPEGAGRKDTLVRREWIESAIREYRRPTDDPKTRILGRDLSGLPAIYLQYSEGELLAEENRRFADELRAAGLSPQVHADAGSFHVLALLPGLLIRSREAVEQIAAFSRAAIATANAEAA